MFMFVYVCLCGSVCIMYYYGLFNVSVCACLLKSKQDKTSECQNKCCENCLQHLQRLLRIWVDKLSRDGHNEEETQPSRWFFGTEALLAQGFPVHPVMHQGFKACAFNFRRLERKGTKIREQSGNSMHVSCPFVCILHSACCWKPSQMTNRRGRSR
jgi:hypothetical protein